MQHKMIKNEGEGKHTHPYICSECGNKFIEKDYGWNTCPGKPVFNQVVEECQRINRILHEGLGNSSIDGMIRGMIACDSFTPQTKLLLKKRLLMEPTPEEMALVRRELEVKREEVHTISQEDVDIMVKRMKENMVEIDTLKEVVLRYKESEKKQLTEIKRLQDTIKEWKEEEGKFIEERKQLNEQIEEQKTKVRDLVERIESLVETSKNELQSAHSARIQVLKKIDDIMTVCKRAK